MTENNDNGASKDAPLVMTKTWDLPLRLFHWGLASSVLIGWYFGEFRDFTTIEWHFYAGYVTACLLIFRLVWGFYGPPNAQFKNIIPSRKDVSNYAKNLFTRKPSGFDGHNPIGGLSVAALLIVLSLQIMTGFYAEDDGLFSSGPLSATASTDWVLIANQLHHNGSRIILGLIILHLAAILFYQIWKRENLIKPMITGKKMVRDKK